MPEVLDLLRNDKIGVDTAYTITMGRSSTPRKPNITWRPTSKIKCPHCEHVSMKKEYIKVD
jgi:hypothetical protein